MLLFCLGTKLLESAQHKMQANTCQKKGSQAALGRLLQGPGSRPRGAHHPRASKPGSALRATELTRGRLLDLPSASFQTSIFSTQPSFMISNSDSEFQVRSLLKT